MSDRVDAEYVAGLGWADRVRAIMTLHRRIVALTNENDVLHAQLDAAIRANHAGAEQPV